MMKVRTSSHAPWPSLALAACNKNNERQRQHAAANDTVTITQANPPPGGDLGRRRQCDVRRRFMMGNPNAKVKLVEIGSLSCPHCKGSRTKACRR